MTYKDHFVVEVKCKGKILRVQDDSVYLPFGSEYSLYLKNLNSKRASVKISIDGEDVLDGSSLILDPNSNTELEGFLKGNSARNKFKFIQKTKEIQDHRGDKVDDGFIRVEFAYEKPAVNYTILREDHHHYHYDWNYRNWFTGDSLDRYSSGGDIKGIVGQPVTATYCCNSSINDSNLNESSLGKPLDDEGITVKGSECNQQFRYSSIGDLEQSEVIIMKLKGITEKNEVKIQQPITVTTKLQCSSCGRMSKSSNKFCPNCGTFLER